MSRRSKFDNTSAVASLFRYIERKRGEGETQRARGHDSESVLEFAIDTNSQSQIINSEIERTHIIFSTY